ncbi:hypothetical protein HMPREF1868_00609 [Olsenella sp. DNF00959]|nr:hypothetical protein HMPREF1868_00609 [Olsenella sp. DNF00959]
MRISRFLDVMYLFPVSVKWPDQSMDELSEIEGLAILNQIGARAMLARFSRGKRLSSPWVESFRRAIDEKLYLDFDTVDVAKPAVSSKGERARRERRYRPAETGRRPGARSMPCFRG